MKALIEIERTLWGKVKDFATVQDLTLSSALSRLLVIALTSEGFTLGKEN